MLINLFFIPSGRSFSVMRRVKSFLRSSMTPKRLNNLMVLHSYKDETDKLNLVDVANEFVKTHESRLSTFGCFTQDDIRC